MAKRPPITNRVKALREAHDGMSQAALGKAIGVTRQTVYRYFASTEALLVAAAVHAVDGFLDRLTEHVAGLTSPPEAGTEAVATALEWLPREKYIGLIMVPGGSRHVESVTSDVALRFARDMVQRLDVDWAAAGYDDADIDELSEHLLRIIQSFVIDPGRPPRRGGDLRAYLRRWVGNALRPS